MQDTWIGCKLIIQFCWFTGRALIKVIGLFLLWYFRFHLPSFDSIFLWIFSPTTSEAAWMIQDGTCWHELIGEQLVNDGDKFANLYCSIFNFCLLAIMNAAFFCYSKFAVKELQSSFRVLQCILWTHVLRTYMYPCISR